LLHVALYTARGTTPLNPRGKTYSKGDDPLEPPRTPAEKAVVAD
jgi:hypothetical protein